MKKLIIAASAIALIASSCTMSAPGEATSNTATKTGVAERKIFLGLAFGHTDLSLATAAKNGGITKIATWDYSITGGLFSKTYRTTVTGE